ncbi:MAG: DUF5694 domain-containing protein [Chloroflexota bacterium]
MDEGNSIKTQVLLLGVFHFKDSGLDAYKPQHDIDILSPQRQQEVNEVVERLAGFQPTKIAIERRKPFQEQTDNQYNDYRNGNFELPGAEHYQLGFRMAARFNHDTVYCTDAWNRYFEPPVDLEAICGSRNGEELNQYLTEELSFDAFGDLQSYADKHGQGEIIPQYYDGIIQQAKLNDQAKMDRTLRETLLLMNREERIWQSHGEYFNGPFRIGKGNEYPGVDYVMSWYTRNLRIFANIQRITESVDDRILVIFGAGHVPILRHCVIAAHEYDLVEVSEYLG